jgi:ribosomal protein S15P/S13E
VPSVLKSLFIVAGLLFRRMSGALDFLKRNDEARYRTLIERLGIRR